jgi:hypothetical protein
MARKQSTTDVARRMREWRRRDRLGLGLYRLALNRYLVDDALLATGLISGAEDDDAIEMALAHFVEAALRRARK